MKDETYAFISDVKEKKVTARSARHTRTHCGKGGRVRLPSDNLSKKELQKMNGECKSYRLNDPMAWQEFMSMPDDIKVTYIKLIREKFNVPDKNIAEMFGVSKDYVYRTFKKLGLQRDIRISHPKWDKEGFYAWWRGVDMLPTPVIKEPTQEEKNAIFFGGTEILPKEAINWVEPEPIKHEEPETFMEDDLPFEEPEFVPVEKYRVMDERMAALEFRMEKVLKENEELKAIHEKDKEEIAWLRNECDNQRMNARILEAQMDVVRLIFGGRNHG